MNETIYCNQKKKELILTCITSSVDLQRDIDIGSSYSIIQKWVVIPKANGYVFLGLSDHDTSSNPLTLMVGK